MADFQAKNIIRTRHDPENPYFLMSRQTAQDKNLSYEAQGMLTYLLSQSDSWEIRIDDLQKKGCKRDKVYRILKELKDAGYIHREKTRDKNGKFIWGDYIVYEHPFTENPDTVKPDTDFQEISTISTKENNYKKNSARREKKAGDVPATPQRERSPIFDTVALESFGIDTTQSKVTDGARIGKIVSWLTSNSSGATAETLKAFYRWYDKETKGANRPRDSVKFGEHFTKFKQAQTAKARTADQKIIDFGLKPLPDEEFEPFSVDAFVSKTVTQEGDNAA